MPATRTRPRTHAATTRTRPRPQPVRPAARRVSGPLRPAAAPAGTGAVRRGTTGVFERIRALPETRLVDGLLRGRVWIWLVGILLGGIVAMQVSLLKLNTGISRAVTTVGTLERQNAAFEADIAQATSGDLVRSTALAKGMVTPLAGDVEFLRARPERDARNAAGRMVPPSEDAASIMANGGRVPGALIVPTTATTTTETSTEAAPVATTETTATTTDTTTTTTTAEPDPAAAAPLAEAETGAVAAPGTE